MPPHFNPKPNEKLKRVDLKEATKMLNQELNNEVSIEPKFEVISKLTFEEIKAKYPERYKVFVAMMESIGRKWGDLDDIEEMKHWIQALNNLENYIAEHNEGGGTLRDRQVSVFEDLHKFLEAGKKHGKIVLPTGVGKTVLFTEFVAALDLPTLIAVPTQILVDQTVDKIQKFRPDSEFGRIYSRAKETGKKITVITYDSLVAGIRNGRINPKDYKALVLDEAHESLSTARQETINKFKNSSIIIEFTATDEYSESKKLTSETIHELSIVEAVGENLLSPFSCIIAKTKVDLSKVRISSRGEYNPEDFEKEVKNQGLNKACVELYEKSFKGRRAIVFAKSISHSHEVKKDFNDKFGPGYAEVLNGNMSPRVQQHIINRYRMGKIKVLIGVDLLTRGFDAPEASVCLNLAPTFSLVRATQRGGRVLRLDESRPGKHAFIVDFLFEDERVRARPILFSEVVGQAVVLSGNKASTKGKVNPSGGTSVYIQRPKIEGLEVVVDEENIMNVTNKTKEKTFFDFNNLMFEVRKMGIKSSYDYSNNQKEKGWPVPLTLYNQPQWIQWVRDGKKPWEEFLGRKITLGSEKIKEIDFEALMKKLRELKIQSSTEYQNNAKKHGLPTIHTLHSKKQWYQWIKDGKDPWDELLGREKFSFSKYMSYVRSLGISTSREYERTGLSKGLMSTYKLFKQPQWQKWVKEGKRPWDEFLGRISKAEQDKQEFERCLNIARKLGIESYTEYRAIYAKEGLKSEGFLTIQPQWIQWVRDGKRPWDEFLGRNKK